MCGFDSCYPCLNFFQNKNKKIRYFNKKKTKLINFYKKPRITKNFFYINIKNKISPVSYFFKKIKHNSVFLNLIFNKFRFVEINVLKFKNFFLSFYLTNYNKHVLTYFFNFILFFWNLNPLFRKNIFKSNKFSLYLHLFSNSQYFLNNFMLRNACVDKFKSLNDFSTTFFTPIRDPNFNCLINFFKNKTFTGPFRPFLKKKIYLWFKFLKITKTRPIYSLFLSRFFFQNLYRSIDRKFNNNLTVFKLLKFDWLNNNLARLTRFSTNFISNDFLTFKSFFSVNLYFNNNLINLFNIYNINDNILEESYPFVYLTTYEKKTFYDLFINKNTLLTFFNPNKTSLPAKISNPLFFATSFRFYKTYNFSIKKNFLTYFQFFIFNKCDFFFTFFFKPLFFKFLNFDYTLNYVFSKNKFLNYTSTWLSDIYYYTKRDYFNSSNLVPNHDFSYILKKRIVKIFNYSKFSTATLFWNYNSLVRFLEFSSGKKVCIKFFSFLINLLDFHEKAQCLLWSQKVKYFRKVLGPRLFLNESLQIIYLALKLKDPYFLSNWMVSTMYKISFWKYKTFLRYIKYVLRYFFWVIFKDLKIKGIKFQLKGKVSVAGNARTRTIFQNVGYTSHTTFNNKILYHLNLVRSFTGVMGLKLWIVF